MHALTNSGAVLLAVLLFFLIILIAELSYIFCRRRTGTLPSPASKEAQEDDAPAMEEEDVAVADKWRVSRLLFTIEEEDLENDDDDVVSTEDGELRVDIPVEFSGEPTPFLTPCDSPPYFTPSPSPGRDIDDVIDVYEVVSNSRSCCFNFQSSQMMS
ncbi:hypothetical protein AALP_AA3G126000 [Arabis alpina]|uniref:Uncharacterized protein n=1 Tax=Arabis alpina TaxID=50452 RepID=A0A087H8S8_ARAAL|nr:hypothetical protein AALP_AA3G126000 [Arabis alpina]